MPDELKARTDTKGEASLRGHLKAEGDEQTGSQSYVPPEAKDDKALKMADRPAARRQDQRRGPAPGDKAAIDEAGQQGRELTTSSASCGNQGGLRAALLFAGLRRPVSRAPCRSRKRALRGRLSCDSLIRTRTEADDD